ncbi:MAG: hypothetical protein IT290_04930, partial [Deltaproteobacteria bacterium]|nr:hypothetical protein [Deltaproteobacteria bacterium]
LIQLKSEFPRIPFYNPLWNAGVEAREFFPSGALNVFFLFSPLVYAFEPTQIYSALVLTLLFGVTPASGYLAARIIGCSVNVGSLSAALAVTSSLFWYRWALSYGTLGFLLSAALVPLVLALWSRLVERGKVGAGDGAAFALFATLSFLWSPALLFFGPILVLGASLAFRGFLRHRGAWILLAVLLVANGTWIAIFLHASRVGDFVSSTAPAAAVVAPEGAALQATKFRDVEQEEGANGRLASLREHAMTFNPLIFCFGVFGVLTIRHRTARIIFSGAVLSAGALALIGPLVKPQLELERMFVVLAQLLAVPTAIVFVRTVESERRWVASILLGSLVILPIWMFRIMKNGTAERFTSAAPIVANLTSAIREHSGSGRTIFAGFTLHELSGGHIAPLPAWTGKPIIASRYQHDRWEYTDVIPKYYRDRGQVGVYEYFDLMNVTAVVTHDRFWRKWISDRPADFELMWKEDRFRIFRRKNVQPSYFVKGEGDVLAQDGSSVRVALRTDQAILKFHYLPFLEADGCLLEPAEFAGGVTLIQIRDCRNSPIEIRAKSIVQRIRGK